MAVYRVSSVSGNGSAPTGGTWAGAATTVSSIAGSLTTADIVLIGSGHVELPVTAWSITAPATPGLCFFSVNEGTEALQYGAQLGIGAGNAGFSVSGTCYFYGVNFRGPTSTGGSTFLAFGTAITLGSDVVLDACGLDWRNSTAGAGPTFGLIPNSTSNDDIAVTLINCFFKFSNAGNSIGYRQARVRMNGCYLDAGTTTPTTLHLVGTASYPIVYMEGCNWSTVSITNLIRNTTTCGGTFYLTRCSLPSGVTVYSNGVSVSSGGPEAFLFDCSVGDNHGQVQYHNGLGSMVTDTGIYFTSGSAAQSWKIVTTSLASASNPFKSLWINLYNTNLSAVTPYFEILRDGSTTAFTNAQVYGEFSAKITSGSVVSTLVNDGQVIFETMKGTSASNQASGAGLGSWTGESGTAWSGKVDSGSSITPAEVGDIRGRVVVPAASATVYVNPEILF